MKKIFPLIYWPVYLLGLFVIGLLSLFAEVFVLFLILAFNPSLADNYNSLILSIPNAIRLIGGFFIWWATVFVVVTWADSGFERLKPYPRLFFSLLTVSSLYWFLFQIQDWWFLN